MSSAVLSIGANLADPLAALRMAVAAHRPWLRAASPVYRTPPWGPVDQPDFLNAILLVADADADADRWLERAHAAEQEAGRTRDVRWGPRTLDVDVITVRAGEPTGDGDEFVRTDPHLTLPHPRAAERAFVLVPWLAVDSEALLGGQRVADLIAALPAEDVSALTACPELELA